MQRYTYSRRRFLLGGILGGCAAALAACGGGPVGGTPPAGPPGPPTPTPRRILGIFPAPPAPSPTPTPPPQVLRFAHWETGPAAHALSTIVERFVQATPRVVVHLDVAPFSQHFATLSQGFASGNPPDVFVNSGVYLADFIRQQALQDLSHHLVLDRLSLDAYWTQPTTQPFDGHQYTLPIWNATEIVFYNRDQFAKLKVAEPASDWTWDDLLNTAQKLTEGKPGQIERWGLLLVNDLQGGWGSFVASNGGRWLDQSGQRTALQDPAAQQALQWYSDAMVVHHVAPRPGEQQKLSQAGQVDPFVAGQVAMFPTGTWEMPSMLAQAHFSWDVCQLPRAPRTGQSETLAAVQPVSAARASHLPDQAWQLLRFLIERDAQTVLAKGKVKLPALKSVATDATAGYATPPPAHVAVAAQVMDHAHDLHFVPHWQAFRTAVVDALEPAFDNRTPLSDALQQAVAKGNAALATG